MAFTASNNTSSSMSSDLCRTSRSSFTGTCLRDFRVSLLVRGSLSAGERQGHVEVLSQRGQGLVRKVGGRVVLLLCLLFELANVVLVIVHHCFGELAVEFVARFLRFLFLHNRL